MVAAIGAVSRRAVPEIASPLRENRVVVLLRCHAAPWHDWDEIDAPGSSPERRGIEANSSSRVRFLPVFQLRQLPEAS